MTDYKKVFLDTAPFIYYIEGREKQPEYYKKMKNFLIDSYENEVHLLTSVVTYEEYLVFPYRTNNQILMDMFERLLETLEVHVVTIDKEIAKKAAKIRAEYKDFKAMDALQLATACVKKCDAFLTNDYQLRQFKEIKCITVDEL